jgi:hypothetical protein
MYDQKVPNAWCPHCGFNAETSTKGVEIIEEPIDDEVTEFIVKKAPQIWSEDKMTEKMCSGGGWWNPITEKCMGEGIGFNVDKL